MKELILSIIAIFFSLNINAGDKSGAIIEFAEKRHDFGMIKEENGAVKHVFEFTNIGNEPLVILDAKATCGCTRPEYPKKPIKPGEKGKIKVTFLPAGRPGEFNKKINLKTNCKGKLKRVTLSINGVVIPKNDE